MHVKLDKNSCINTSTTNATNLLKRCRRNHCSTGVHYNHLGENEDYPCCLEKLSEIFLYFKIVPNFLHLEHCKFYILIYYTLSLDVSHKI